MRVYVIRLMKYIHFRYVALRSRGQCVLKQIRRHALLGSLVFLLFFLDVVFKSFSGVECILFPQIESPKGPVICEGTL